MSVGWNIRDNVGEKTETYSVLRVRGISLCESIRDEVRSNGLLRLREVREQSWQIGDETFRQLCPLILTTKNVSGLRRIMRWFLAILSGTNWVLLNKERSFPLNNFGMNVDGDVQVFPFKTTVIKMRKKWTLIRMCSSPYNRSSSLTNSLRTCEADEVKF